MTSITHGPPLFNGFPPQVLDVIWKGLVPMENGIDDHVIIADYKPMLYSLIKRSRRVRKIVFALLPYVEHADPFM